MSCVGVIRSVFTHSLKHSIKQSLCRSLNASLTQSNHHLTHRSFHTSIKQSVQTTIPLTFRVNGKDRPVDAELYMSMLAAAQDGRIDDIEGACGGGCACSTCHVILDKDTYNALPPPSDEEQDLLDNAPQCCETSRLACQVSIEPFMAGKTVIVPSEFKNQEDF